MGEYILGKWCAFTHSDQQYINKLESEAAELKIKRHKEYRIQNDHIVKQQTEIAELKNDIVDLHKYNTFRTKEKEIAEFKRENQVLAKKILATLPEKLTTVKVDAIREMIKETGIGFMSCGCVLKVEEYADNLGE